MKQLLCSISVLRQVLVGATASSTPTGLLSDVRMRQASRWSLSATCTRTVLVASKDSQIVQMHSTMILLRLCSAQVCGGTCLRVTGSAQELFEACTKSKYHKNELLYCGFCDVELLNTCINAIKCKQTNTPHDRPLPWIWSPCLISPQ